MAQPAPLRGVRRYSFHPGTRFLLSRRRLSQLRQSRPPALRGRDSLLGSLAKCGTGSLSVSPIRLGTPNARTRDDEDTPFLRNVLHGGEPLIPRVRGRREVAAVRLGCFGHPLRRRTSRYHAGTERIGRAA